MVSHGSSVTAEPSDLHKFSSFIHVFGPTEFADVQ